MIRRNTKLVARRLQEATNIIRALGMPTEQQNDRSALTLLALLDLPLDRPWHEAKQRLIGVTPIMEFCAHEYARNYAPNTRETFRRYTLHQFVQAGLVEINPDNPSRPTNSPKNVYQVSASALALLKQYGTPQWETLLQQFRLASPSLQAMYSHDRAMSRIPLSLPDGGLVRLSPGAHSQLSVQIIEEFCPRFTPGASPIYIGDTSEKWAYFDQPALAQLGVTVNEHGKMPDVVVHFRQKDWLVLVEAVTSHGPISPKRIHELKELFATCSIGLVYVTAFPDAKLFAKYAREIAWETEVWIADAPTHMIHFNGERFLGPY